MLCLVRDEDENRERFELNFRRVVPPMHVSSAWGSLRSADDKSTSAAEIGGRKLSALFVDASYSDVTGVVLSRDLCSGGI
jgi:hypothetical protein